MSLIDLAEIFWTFVTVIELEYLLGRHNPVKVAEDEKNGEVLVKFFEHG
jgi:hypothetical protein